jgi:hypothetical protein
VAVLAARHLLMPFAVNMMTRDTQTWRLFTVEHSLDLCILATTAGTALSPYKT